jgi:hypothetical protein
MLPVVRNLKLVGPIPAELGTEALSWSWGQFTEPNFQRTPVEPATYGYFVSLGQIPSPGPVDEYTRYLVQPMRYTIHSWSEGFYGVKAYNGTILSKRSQNPLTYSDGEAGRGRGWTSPPYEFMKSNRLTMAEGVQVVPPTSRMPPSSAWHMLNYNCNTFGWRGSGNDIIPEWYDCGTFGFGGLGYSIYRTYRELMLRWDLRDAFMRILVDGVDATGVMALDESNPNNTSMSPTWVQTNLGDLRNARVDIDLWSAVYVKPVNWVAGPCAPYQALQEDCKAGSRAIRVGSYEKSNPLAGWRLDFYGNPVGGQSQVYIDPATTPAGWQYVPNESFFNEALGQGDFLNPYSDAGEGVRIMANAEIPGIQVIKAKPAPYNDLLRKRFVWYLPVPNSGYEFVLMPNGFPKHVGGLPQTQPTLMKPFAEGFYLSPGDALPNPGMWLDPSYSGTDLPWWSSGDTATYSNYPTSILVSPP